MFRRFFAFLAAFVILFAVSVPAFAAELVAPASSVQLGLDVVSFADALVGGLIGTGNFFRSFLDDDVCPECPHLHGQHDFLPKRTKIDGKISVYYICRYCGLSAGEVLSEAYQSYVGGLPATQYNSDGSFVWTPAPADFGSATVSFEWYHGPWYGHATMPVDGSSRWSGSIKGATASGWAVPYDGFYVTQGTSTTELTFEGASFRAPWDGYYTPLVPYASSVSRGSFGAGSTLSIGRVSHKVSLVFFAWPSWSVAPLFPVADFSLGSRVSASVSGNGMFGYIGDGGQLCQSTVGEIYNETTNVYQNPVTGDVSNISSWNYDYSDRSYTLFTDDSQQITVTYGDESILIDEGSTIYNVYYLMSDPEDVQEDTSHTHSWTSQVAPPTCTGTGIRTLTCTECGWQITEVIPATGHNFSAPMITQEPTCTTFGVRAGTCTACGEITSEPIPALGHDYQAIVTMEPGCVVTGVRTHTCTRCGDSYTTSIPATGHTWRKIASVPTQYDESTGELAQQGYTLYRCATCAEEYRVTSETGGAVLPDAGSGGLSSGTGTGNTDLTELAQETLEASPTVLQLLSGWFTAFPASFAGFSGFLQISFGWMPSEVVTMLSFSVGMICFIGIFRFAFRR